jgi:hypothetical protein
MHRSTLYVLILGCVVVSFVREAKAQATRDALTPSLPINTGVAGPYPLSYVIGGIGWTFTPTADLLVTGISSSAPQVSFWLGTNQILETFDYNNHTTTNYSIQPISPLLLSAGQNYSISTQNSNFTSSVNILIGSPTGVDGIPVVSISSYLTNYTGSFSVSINGDWNPIASPDNADYISLFPNFQFQVVPEPMSLELMILGFLFWFGKLKGK